MAKPIMITAISLYMATTRLKNRWKGVYGDDLPKIVQNIEKFLLKIPEYRALPAYLLLGDGITKPSNFEPTLKYIYTFYSKTAGQLDSMMLENAGEFNCIEHDEFKVKPFVVTSPERINKIKVINQINEEIVNCIERRKHYESEANKLLVIQDRKSMKLRSEEYSLSLMPEGIENDISDLVNKASEAMPALGFQPLGVTTSDIHVNLIFAVLPRKVYSAYTTSDKPVGRLHQPFMMKLVFKESGEFSLVPPSYGDNKKPTATVCNTPHPHIATGICWGNGSYDAAKASKDRDPVRLLALFDSLLRVYNYRSPYITLADYSQLININNNIGGGAKRVVEYLAKARALHGKGLTLSNVLGNEWCNQIAKLDGDYEKIYTDILTGEDNEQ